MAVDRDKIRRIKLDQKEQEMKREIERIEIQKQMEIDALKDQLEKLQKENDEYKEALEEE